MAIYGRAGTLKSWLAINMAFDICQGKRWLGHPTIKSSVLIIQTEQTEPIYAERIIKYAHSLNGRELPTNLSFDNDLTLKLDGFTGLQTLFQDIEERKPGVVILDCLYQMVSGSVSNQVDLNRFKDNIDKTRQKFGTSFVIIHHPRKAGRDEDEDLGFEEMLTSSIFANWLDTIIKVSAVPHNADNPTNILLTFQKVKDARQPMLPIQVRFSRDTARFGLA